MAAFRFLVLACLLLWATPALIFSDEQEDKDARFAVKRWIALAQDKSSPRRQEAIWALGDMRPVPKMAIPALLECLKDKSSEVQYSAACAFRHVDTTADEIVPRLVELLRDKNTVQCACWALSRLGPSARSAIPALLKIEQGTDADAANSASLTLRYIWPRNESNAWSILRSIGRVPVHEWKEGIKRLEQIAPEAVLAACMDALSQGSPQLRLAALEVLTGMGPPSAIVGPAIAGALRDNDRGVRKSAVRGLAICLKYKDTEVRARSAALLRRAGADARDALPALIEALADQDIIVRGQAAFALAGIGAPAVPQLVETLKSQNIDARRLAVIALGKIGPDADVARPALTSLLQDADAELRMSSAEALKKIGLKVGQ
jgi:HEAT repeat protein